MKPRDSAEGQYIMRTPITTGLRKYLGQRVKIDPTTATYRKGDTRKLTVRITFKDGTKRNLSVSVIDGLTADEREMLHFYAMRQRSVGTKQVTSVATHTRPVRPSL